MHLHWFRLGKWVTGMSHPVNCTGHMSARSCWKTCTMARTLWKKGPIVYYSSRALIESIYVLINISPLQFGRLKEKYHFHKWPKKPQLWPQKLVWKENKTSHSLQLIYSRQMLHEHVLSWLLPNTRKHAMFSCGIRKRLHEGKACW